MIINGNPRQQIITPDAMPEARKVTTGKGIDGSIFIEIEGAGRVCFSPQGAIKFAVGILRACDISVDFGTGPRQ
jgi:hypothetical protein